VGRPHGLDGSFVVERASEHEERFAVGAKLLVDGRPATVVSARRVGGGRRAIKLDREVERGAELAVEREDLPHPEPGSYYVADLVGLRVEEQGGDPLGTVRDVLPGVANDMLELDSGVLLPMIEDCVLLVDVEAGSVVVAPGFVDHG
jgi:16S rRNA processing protein RimM